MGLRVTTAECFDLCHPRFGVPTFASRWSQREDILPSYHDDPAAYAQVLLDLVRTHPTRVLIPTMDGSIAALRPWRASFERQGVSVALASDAALELANDKQRTLAAAAELRILQPRSVTIDRLEDTEAALEEVGYPAVIKPCQSWITNTDFAVRVTAETVLDLPEALAYVQQLNEVGSSVALVQELATGTREAVSVFYARRKSMGQLCATGSPYDAGHGRNISRTREHIHARRAGICRTRTRARHGPGGLQRSRVSPRCQGPSLLMEINARLSGSLEVAIRSGVPFPALLWQWASGEPLTPVSGYRTGIKMRYLKGDIKWLKENIETRGRRPGTVPTGKAITIFAGDFLRRQRYDYLDKSDLGPSLAALAGNVGLAQQSLTRNLSALPLGRLAPVRAPRSTVLPSTDVVVIGAGPNGLSVGAHLGHAGIEHRVFGHTMGAWRSNMPSGMILKSEPYASDLSAPGMGFRARLLRPSQRVLPRKSRPAVSGTVHRLWQLVRRQARAQRRRD